MPKLDSINRPLSSAAEVHRHIVLHMQENRAALLDEWVCRIASHRLLIAMSSAEVHAEAGRVFDSYVKALQIGTLEALRAYARNLSERIVPPGVQTHEVVGSVLLLRNVLARSLFAIYREQFEVLDGVLDAYEPAAIRGSNTAIASLVQGRDRILCQQQETILELSTPMFAMMQLGVELTGITTALNLAEALERSLAQRGQPGVTNGGRPSTPAS